MIEQYKSALDRFWNKENPLEDRREALLEMQRLQTELGKTGQMPGQQPLNYKPFLCRGLGEIEKKTISPDLVLVDTSSDSRRSVSKTGTAQKRTTAKSDKLRDTQQAYKQPSLFDNHN